MFMLLKLNMKAYSW